MALHGNFPPISVENMNQVMPENIQEAPLVSREELEGLETSNTSTISSLQSWEFSYDQPFQVALQQALPTELSEEYVQIAAQIPLLEKWLQNVYDKLETAQGLVTNDDASGRISNAMLSVRTLCTATEMALRSLGSDDVAVIEQNYEGMQKAYRDTFRTLNNTQHQELRQVMHQIPREVKKIMKNAFGISERFEPGLTESTPPFEVTVEGRPNHPLAIHGTSATPVSAEGK